MSAFLRADGGFGGTADGALKPHPIPDRAPDQTIILPTRHDQALLYRLSGGYNALHADPAAAVAAGFDPPILHGLFRFGVVGRGLIGALLPSPAARAKALG